MANVNNVSRVIDLKCEYKPSNGSPLFGVTYAAFSPIRPQFTAYANISNENICAINLQCAKETNVVSFIGYVALEYTKATD